jgi:23S rRNA (cytidine1920-2'-O)/16S rRNA (cytidine1409-2'-O)-methyltransferase
VSDPAVHDAVVAQVTDYAASAGLTRVGLTASPIKGASGNQEFLMHLKLIFSF